MNRVKAASNGTAQTVQTSDFVPTKPVKLALVKFRSQVLALPHSAPERASHISQILAAFATKCLPQLIPDVDPAALRDFLAAHAGDRLGLQHRPWKAASKALRQALGLLGIERMPRRREHEPSEA